MANVKPACYVPQTIYLLPFSCTLQKCLPAYCGLLLVWANQKSINADKEILNTFSPPLAKEIPCMSWLVTNLPFSMLVNLMPADDTVMFTFVPEFLMEGISKKINEQNSNQHINKMKVR